MLLSLPLSHSFPLNPNSPPRGQPNLGLHDLPAKCKFLALRSGQQKAIYHSPPMWCDKCKKEVDINSVAVNKPRGALSMDIEGDVTPTIIHSTSNIINICKSCGESDYLFDSEASARREDERQQVQWELDKTLRERDAEKAKIRKKVWATGCKISLCMALAYGAIGVARDLTFLDAVINGVVGGVLGIAGTWAVSNLKEK